MTKAQKAKWIEALRSGKYQQGKDMLYRAGRYCCLGVAGVAVFGKSTTELRGGLMPGDCDYRVTDVKVETELSYLNDGDERVMFEPKVSLPFEVIAGVIDQWVETDD